MESRTHARVDDLERAREAKKKLKICTCENVDPTLLDSIGLALLMPYLSQMLTLTFEPRTLSSIMYSSNS